MNIGIIGAGNIGSAVAQLLTNAGHSVRVGSRHPAGDQVTVLQAISHGDIVVVAVPYGVWPDLAVEIGDHLEGKIVVDAGNPNPGRDGPFAINAMQHPDGPGGPIASLLPATRLVRTFSTMVASKLLRFSDVTAPKYALPVAGDDDNAVKVVSALIRDSGFVPVPTGGLSTARFFATGEAVFGGDMTAADATASMMSAGLVLRSPDM